ncbi:hypothetical protein [Novacetimonas maltaceti]|uniref:hypothetical protein n=1 Tax=Novacetimonas maltaceti TaxID=1203393 RepID=UPI0011AFC9A9|nr:hypothetical protein [Novacetimonas maltaceti]
MTLARAPGLFALRTQWFSVVETHWSRLRGSRFDLIALKPAENSHRLKNNHLKKNQNDLLISYIAAENNMACRFDFL